MFEFGTIVLVPFPFSDLSSAKVRPALVVSGNTKGDDIIVCFITSKTDAKNGTVMPLPANERTGLKVKSAVRFDKIVTLHRRIILGEIGRADNKDLLKYRERFFQVFGFDLK